ncbi:unnamed protein product, partial [Polarella glacialis]
ALLSLPMKFFQAAAASSVLVALLSVQCVVPGNAQEFSASRPHASASDVLLSVEKRLSDAREMQEWLREKQKAFPGHAAVAAAATLCSDNATDASEACVELQADAPPSIYFEAAAEEALMSRSSALFAELRASMYHQEEQAELRISELEPEPLFIEEAAVVVPKSNLLTLVLEKSEMVTETIGTTVYHRSAYWGTLQVGSPAQPFKVVFDTGSGHLILPSTYCSDAACKAHSRYSVKGSSTSKDINQDGDQVLRGAARDQLSVSFGTGEVTGVFVEDKVCFEDGSSGPSSETQEAEGSEAKVECVPMRFIAATSMSEDPFKDFVFDGVLGLGLSGLSQSDSFNFLKVMSGHAQTAEGGHGQTFGVFLAEHGQEHSAITFGGWEEQRLQEGLRWSPVVDPDLGHWQIRIKSLRVDGVAIPFCHEGCKGVVDTGTSLMSVPSEVFPEIY